MAQNDLASDNFSSVSGAKHAQNRLTIGQTVLPCAPIFAGYARSLGAKDQMIDLHLSIQKNPALQQSRAAVRTPRAEKSSQRCAGLALDHR
jgi:hypothetical protein